MPIKTQSLPKQGTLPFNRASSGRTVEVKESVVEGKVDYHLRADGATVLSTVHRYKLQTCPNPKCGAQFWPQGGYGATPGVPDRLARLDHWPRGVWLGLELKGSKTRLSPEQKVLLANGAIYVCRSGEEASDALARANEDLQWDALSVSLDALAQALESRSLRAAFRAMDDMRDLLESKTRHL